MLQPFAPLLYRSMSLKSLIIIMIVF